MADHDLVGGGVQDALQSSGEVMQKGTAIINSTVTNLTAVHEWGDLLVGPYNESQSEEWRREWVNQYRLRHQNDPEVKYAIVIFYLILFTLLGSQAGIYYWKQKHKRSYELVTLVGLWLIPVVFSFYFKFWLFIIVWFVFSLAVGYTLRLAAQRHMAPSTPQHVYSFFFMVYWTSVIVGMLGYSLLVLELIGIGSLLRPFLNPAASLQLLWYGLYFGVLGRDFAEVVSDTLASTMGTRRRIAVSVRSCGICTQELPTADFSQNSESQKNSVQLSCKHIFHTQCIRGWTIVGKKDTCPVCMEKVDLKKIFSDRPWETTNLNWNQMLDMVRYMVVWNPIILIGLHFMLHAVGLESDGNSPPSPMAAVSGNLTAPPPPLLAGDVSKLHAF